MKIKGLIIALAILAAVVAGYFIVSSAVSRAEADKETAESAGRLIGCAPEDVCEITYNYKGETYHFIRPDAETDWSFPEKPDFPLKQRLVNKMADTVEEFISIQTVSESGADSFDQYGLASPQCVLSLKTFDGENFMFNIGNISDLPKGYYVNTIGTEDIHIVKRDAECYLLNLFELAKQDSLPYVKSGEAMTLSLKNEKGEFSMTHYEGGMPGYYNSDVEWFIDTEDGTLVAVSISQLREYITNVNAMEINACAFYPYSEADPAEFGLEDGGRAQLQMTYMKEAADGTKSESTYLLTVGSPAPERDGYFTYVRVGDSDMISTIKTADIESYLTGIDEDHFLSKDVCVVDHESILAMDFTVEDVTYHFTSTKEDAVDEFGYDVVLSTFYLEGEEVDAEYFRVMQSGISSIDAEAFADDGDAFAGEKPYIRIVYTTDTMKDEVLEFVPYNANFYLARFGGRDDMLVNKQDIRTAVSRLENLLESMQPDEAAAG